MMRRILPPGTPQHRLHASALINTLALANEARALAGLFPLVSDLGAIESVFREVLLATKPSTFRYDDPTYIAVRGMTRVLAAYYNLGREWEAAGKTAEAEESRQRAAALLRGLPAQLASHPDLLQHFQAQAAIALMQAGQPGQATELAASFWSRRRQGQAGCKTTRPGSWPRPKSRRSARLVWPSSWRARPSRRILNPPAIGTPWALPATMREIGSGPSRTWSNPFRSEREAAASTSCSWPWRIGSSASRRRPDDSMRTAFKSWARSRARSFAASKARRKT